MNRSVGTVSFALCLLAAACAGRKKDGPERPPRLDRVGAARVADELDQALTRGVVACRALAQNAHVRAFYSEKKQPHKVLTVLRDVVTRSAAERALLLDSDGVVIAATDPEAVGYDFSHWAFFRDAVKGKILVFPSVGYVSEQRGLFCVAPQEDESGAPRGAVVLRMSVGPLDRTMEHIGLPSALVFRERYVLATNRPHWGFHGLRGLDERQAGIDLAEKDLLGMLDRVVPPIRDTIVVEDEVYDVHRFPMAIEEWQLLVCVPRAG